MKPTLKPFWVNALNNIWFIIFSIALIANIINSYLIDSKYTYNPRNWAGYDTVNFNDSGFATFMQIDSVWYDPEERDPPEPMGR